MRSGGRRAVRAGFEALGPAVLWVCAWRAATASLTHDEALTWLGFLHGPFGALFDSYSANHHVLHTALAWLSVRAFGASELAYRLPALLGALLVVTAGRRLVLRWFGGGWLGLLVLALVLLDPLLLDMLCVARGYGLGLGCLLWALADLAADTPRPARASAWLGLAAAANLVYAPLGLALAGSAWLASVRAPSGDGPAPVDAARAGRSASGLTAPGLALRLLAPGLLVGGALLAGPLLHLDPQAFIVGADSPLEAARSLLRLSFEHHELRVPFDTTAGWYRTLVGPVAAGIAGLLLGLGAWRWSRRTSAPGTRLVDGTLLLGVLGFSLAGWLALGRWPTDRMAIAVIPLSAFALGFWVRDAQALAVRALAGGLAGLVLTLFLLQFQWQRQGLWWLDAGTRQFVGIISARQETIPLAKVKVVLSHGYYEPAFLAYRDMRGLPWLELEVADEPPPSLPCDYLVVAPGAWGRLLAGDLGRVNVIAIDPISGTLLVVPKHRAR